MNFPAFFRTKHLDNSVNYLQYQKMVKGLSEFSSKIDIYNCIAIYNKNFSHLTKQDLTQYPIAKESQIFLQFLFPIITSVLDDHQENISEVLMCFSSITNFTIKDKNTIQILCQITLKILASTNKSVQEYANLILCNFSKNTFFSEFIIKHNFSRIYHLGNSMGQPNADISFRFLKKCIFFTQILPSSVELNSIKSHFFENGNDHLHLMATIDFFSKSKLDFDSYNKQILKINNCSCYKILFKIDQTTSKIKIQQLFQHLNDDLGISLIKLFLKIPTLISNYKILTNYLRFLNSDEQSKFFEIISKRMNDSLKEFLKELLPPWQFQIDGIVLFKVLSQQFDENELSIILNQILSMSEYENLILAFSTCPHFSDLIVSLFQTNQSIDSFSASFLTMIQLIIKGETNSPIDCLIEIMDQNEPAFFIDILIDTFSEIIQNDRFLQKFTKYANESVLIQHYFLNEKVLSILILNGIADLLAVLASSGPHEIIDQKVTELFEKSKLKYLKANQLTKLAKGLLQSSEDVTTTIKIPSLLMFVQFEFTSLSDRYTIGKYLISKHLIDDNSILIEKVGIQYLTEKLSLSAIENPFLLHKLTDPFFPHCPVFQFTIGQPNSHILIKSDNFDFSFRIDEYCHKIVLLENPLIELETDHLIINKNNIKCEFKTWNNIHINLSNILHQTVTVNHKYQIVIEPVINKSPIIGSIKEKPGSTFYIKSPLECDYRCSINCTFVDYKGILYFLPYLDLFAIILKKLLEVENKDNFLNLIKSMFNLRIITKEFNLANFLKSLRIIMINRSQFVTVELIELILKLITENGDVNWVLFKIVFIDYLLWSKIPSILINSICPLILHEIQKDSFNSSIFRDLSLLDFLFDLTIQFNLNDDILFHLILNLLLKSPNPSYLIHLICHKELPIIQFLSNEPLLLENISIEFISYLSNDQSLKLFQLYSKSTQIDFEKLNKLFPFLKSHVTNEMIWVSLFSIMCDCDYKELRAFRNCIVKRPEVIDLLFKLICAFYQLSNHQTSFENNHFFQTGLNSFQFNFIETEMNGKLLIDIVSMINLIFHNSTDLRYFDLIESFRYLACFGLFQYEFNDNPIKFSEFETCRMPVELQPRSETISNSIDFISPLSSSLFLSTDSFFGFPSKTFIEVCDQEISSMNLFTLTIDQPTNIKQHPKIIFELICDIVATFFVNLNPNQYEEALNRILLLTSNVNPHFSIQVHQTVILSILRSSTPNVELLTFLRKTLIAGWWEDQLIELCESLCVCVTRIKTTKEFFVIAELFKILFVLITDYRKINLKFYSAFIFHPRILSNLSNLMFFIFVLMSDSMLNQPIEMVSEIWLSFLFSLKNVDLTTLSKILHVHPNTLIPTLTELVYNTNCFSSIQNNQFCFELKQLSKSAYDGFLLQIQSEMKNIYNEIGQIRANSISPTNQFLVFNFEKYFQSLYDFIFKTRFNILSLQNEQDSFTLFQYIPKLNTQQYQKEVAFRPIYPSFLLVQMYSEINYEDPLNYAKTKDLRIEIGSQDLKLSEIPHLVDLFVSQPFCELPKSFILQLFKLIFCHFSAFYQIDIVLYESQVPSVLFISKSEILFLINAKFDNGLCLLPFSENLDVNTFLNNCVAKYYSKINMFFGHIVLSFQFSDICYAIYKDFHPAEKIGCELYVLNKFSLFILFQNLETIEKVFNTVLSKEICIKRKKFDTQNNNSILQYQSDWVNHRISSFEYLLILNFYANRSFLLPSQYPIMPDLITFKKIEKDSTKIVLHQFQRIQPFTNSLFEYSKNEKIELFVSLNKENEFIPEIFLFPEIFDNINYIKQKPFNSGSDDEFPKFELPLGIDNTAMLSFDLLNKLNQSENIEKYIDLMFGKESSFSRIFDHPHPKRQSSDHFEFPFLSNSENNIFIQELTFKHMPQKCRFFKLFDNFNSDCEFLFMDHSIYPISKQKFLRYIFSKQYLIQDHYFEWEIQYGDVIFINFSQDQSRFSLLINNGTMLAFNINFSNFTYQQIAIFRLPIEFREAFDSQKFEITAISSLLNICLYASNSTLFLFHLQSSNFIRSIELINKVVQIEFHDDFQLILGFASYSIEIHTINGTKLGYLDIPDNAIQAASVASNPNVVLFATGHQDGSIRIWSFDLMKQEFIFQTQYQFSSYPMKTIRFVEDGCVLFGIDHQNQSKLYVSNTLGKELCQNHLNRNCLCFKNMS